MELGEFGIRVNAICPGTVDGERNDSVIAAEARSRGVSEEKIRTTYLQQTSLRTFVSCYDIAKLVLYLCSEAGEKISGQALTIDGHTESMR